MSELDRRLEDLFAADARARRVDRLTIERPGRPWLAFALAGTAALLIGLALALATLPDGQRPAGPEATPSATPTQCVDTTQVIPSLQGAKVGAHMGLSLDRVTLDHAAAQWHVRSFIGPGASGDPGAAAMPLRVTIEGPSGPVPVLGYAAGPPDGPFTPVTGEITVQPCRPVVLRITSAQIDDGQYTLTLPDIRRPEGGTSTVPIRMQLVCETVAGGDKECRNPAGQGTFGPVPTSSAAPTAPPAGSGIIAGRVGYPAGFRPALTVYVIDVNDRGRYHSVDVPEDTTGREETGNYILEVTPGTYHVVAYFTERSAGPPARPDKPGIYSQYVPCGLTVRCSDHSLIPVTVAAGETRTGIDPTDWYYPEGTDYPPRPD